jgi:hypothetical protein
MKSNSNKKENDDEEIEEIEEVEEKSDIVFNIFALSFITFSIFLCFYLPSPTMTSIKIFSIYFVLQFLFARFLPGKIGKSIPTSDGKILTYRVNGNELFYIRFIGILVIYFFI